MKLVFYIRGPREGQAWTNPCIPISSVDNINDRRMLGSVTKSASIWKLLFQRFETNATINDNELELNSDIDDTINVSDQLKIERNYS